MKAFKVVPRCAWPHRSACPDRALEIKDQATGEMLDVVRDNDPDLPREPDLQGGRISHNAWRQRARTPILQ